MNFLVVLLVLSNIATGVFSFYLLRKVDARYSELIEKSVPVLNDMQTLTAVAVEIMRGTNPRHYGGTPEEQAKVMQSGRAALERDRAMREKLLTVDWMPIDAVERVELKNAGEAFTREASAVYDHYAAGSHNPASQSREDSLRPAFERYLVALTVASDELEARSLKTSNALTEDTGSFSKIVLGVAGWPLIVLMALLLVTVCFVVVLMFVFRGKEMSDMP
jgi:hypothetical protein